MSLRIAACLPLIALVSACGIDPGAGSDGDDTVWVISEIDGVPFPARGTLSFESGGQIAGTAPCNEYRAALSAQAPRFDTGPITVTRASCAQGSLEVQYLYTLSQMTRIDVSGRTLTLSEPGGSSMVFKAAG